MVRAAPPPLLLLHTSPRPAALLPWRPCHLWLVSHALPMGSHDYGWLLLSDFLLIASSPRPPTCCFHMAAAAAAAGKTAAFALPLLERLLHRNRRVSATYVLVLTPVRELAVQVRRGWG